MRRTPLLVAAGALAAAAPAAATLPFFPSGSAVGEGVPLKAYASVTPTVHLFGDELTARLAIVADRKWIDPARLRVAADFRPYEPTRAPAVLRLKAGRFAQVTWTWTLRCLTSPCVPRPPPSDKYHVFRFHPVHIDYVAQGGRPAYGITASWPAVEVLSQVSPGVVAFLERTNHLNWRFHLSPLAAPTYRMSPAVLFWVALGLGLAALLLAAILAPLWYREVRPQRFEPDVAQPTTTLERALAVLAWAHERGDETLQRKAFARVAGELPVEAPAPQADELSRAARELAWSQRTPGDEEVEEFAEQARGTIGKAQE